ncbi:MAG: ribonuclease HI family protein [Candidatus Schekmanbacteria bacterium]|nr:ribonuclease HI family protein [Candidatus Schekmanbacteria bacterium]
MLVKIFTDGGSRGNPGEAAAAAIIYNGDNNLLEQQACYLGQATNNIAEYQGMILGLTRAQALGATQVELHADSELIVKQMQGKYKVKHEGLIPLFGQAQKLAQKFERIVFKHIPREENKAADRLVNQTLDKAKKPKI